MATSLPAASEGSNAISILGVSSDFAVNQKARLFGSIRRPLPPEQYCQYQYRIPIHGCIIMIERLFYFPTKNGHQIKGLPSAQTVL